MPGKKESGKWVCLACFQKAQEVRFSLMTLGLHVVVDVGARLNPKALNPKPLNPKLYQTLNQEKDSRWIRSDKQCKTSRYFSFDWM